MERYTLSAFKQILLTKIFSRHHSFRLSNAALSYSIQDSNSTIDPEDIKRHTMQAKYWWDPNSKMNFLHSFNYFRVPFIRDGLVPPSEDKRRIAPLANRSILDVGCGGGFLTEGLARIGAKMTGIDASQDLIKIAEEHSLEDPKIVNNRPKYYCNTIEEHSIQFCDHYDAVVASEIIEHVSDKELFVKSCVNALKPSGMIFFTTPCRTRMTQIFGIFLAENVLNMVPKGTHQYAKLMTPNELTFLLERIMDDKLRYLAVRPTASISQLRQKVWHLLELPDYCEEIIILKRENFEIPLTELRKGNDPQNPYILEVWLPGKQRSSMLNNMLTIGENRPVAEDFDSPESILQEKVNHEYIRRGVENETTKRNETITMNTMHSMENKQNIRKLLKSEYKKSDVSCKMSTSSIFFKVHGRKSRDNFANMLLKIQSDLTTLNTKLSDLENRIHL